MKVNTIAFYHWIFPGGGAETVTCNLGSFFAGQNIRMIVYTPQLVPEKLTDTMSKRFEIRVLPDKDNRCSPANIEFLCNSIRQEQVDCVIIQSAKNFPFGEVRRRCTARLIFCLHNTPFWEVFDFKHKTWHDVHYFSFIKRIEFVLLRRPIYRLTHKAENRYIKIYTKLLGEVDRFITLCPDYLREFRRAIEEANTTENVFPEAHYGSILNPLLPPREPIETPKEKMVLYAGRFQRIHKRVDRLLRIWKEVERENPEWKLVLAGDGRESGDLKRLAKRLKLQRVEFAGYQQDLAPYYRRASFVCLTSNFEGMPMCLTEGQQYGAIPVSFDSYSGIREITCNGEAGIMVPAYDTRKYAAVLSAALKDEALQERMRRKSYEAARRYTPETIGRQWLRLFEQME